MNTAFYIGIIGSLILVTGAAWPEAKKNTHPAKSLKNWLFTIGGIFMLTFSILNYIAGGPIFYIFLQVFLGIATILMMLNTPDKIDSPIILICGLAFIIWSLTLFESLNTIYFILGLSGIGLGYVFNMGTLRRNLALTLGSALIALFSYIEASWIFFWLNVFFALFSAYYLFKPFFNKKSKN